MAKPEKKVFTAGGKVIKGPGHQSAVDDAIDFVAEAGSMAATGGPEVGEALGGRPATDTYKSLSAPPGDEPKFAPKKELPLPRAPGRARDLPNIEIPEPERPVGGMAPPKLVEGGPPLGIPEYLWQQGGFYFPPNYKDMIDKAYGLHKEYGLGPENGAINQEQYDFLRERYNTSPGLGSQLAQLQFQGQRDQLAFEQDHARQRLDAMEERQRAQQEQHAQSAQLRKQQLEARQQKMAFVDSKRKEVEDINAKVRDMRVDPNSHWSKSSMPGKIAAGVAVALGAFGAALAKTPNYAMEIVESDIRNHLDSQRANMAHAQQGARAKRDELADAYTQLEDQDLMYEAQYKYHMEHVAAQLDALDNANLTKLQRSRIGEAKRRVDQFVAESEKRIEIQAATAHEKIERDRILANQSALRGHAAGVARGKQAQKDRARLELYGVEIKDHSRVIDGVGVIKKNIKGAEATKIRETVASNHMVRGLIGDARDLIGQFQGAKGALHHLTRVKIKQDLKAIQSKLQSDSMKKYAGAARTAIEIAAIIPMLGGDFSSLTDNMLYDTSRNLDTALELNNAEVEALYAVSVDPAQINYVPNERGEPIPHAQYKVRPERAGYGADPYGGLQPGKAGATPRTQPAPQPMTPARKEDLSPPDTYNPAGDEHGFTPME